MVSSNSSLEEKQFDQDEDCSVDSNIVIVGLKNFDEDLTGRFKAIVKEIKVFHQKISEVKENVEERYKRTKLD